MSTEKINEGKRLIEQGKFPAELLESIKESRRRKDVYSGIFFTNEALKGRKISESGKKALLKVQFAFIDYLSAKEKFRPSGFLLLTLGFLVFSTGVIGIHFNTNHGVASMLEGIAVILCSLRFRLIQPYLGRIVLALIITLVLEYAVFGIPGTFMEFIYHARNFEGAMRVRPAGGALFVMFNESTPILYLMAKLGAIYMIGRLYFKQKKFLQARDEFEQSV